MSQPRAVIQWFAQEMEAKLAVYDSKPDWVDEPQDALLKKLFEELSELVDAVVFDRVQEIPKEAADLANVAMFFADRARAHPSSNRGRNDVET